MAARQSKTGITSQHLMEEELYGVLLKADGEAAAFPPAAIDRAIFAAEDFFERDLAIRFRTTPVYGDGFGRKMGSYPESPALSLAPEVSEVNAIFDRAYDYEAEFQSYDRWGEFALNYRPVRSIEQLLFALPGLGPVYEVPKRWLRVDHKFGKVQIVPSGNSQIATSVLSAFVLRLGTAGVTFPQSIIVDYQVGFTPEELEANHQDLLNGVRLRALLGLGGVITSTALPGGQTGGSLSIDGQSQSRNFGKFGPHTGKILLAQQEEAAIRESWRRREKGLSVAFA